MVNKNYKTVVWLLSIMGLLGCGDKQPSLPQARDHTPVKTAVRQQLQVSQEDFPRLWRDFLAIFPTANESFGLNWNEQMGRFTGDVAAAAILQQRCVLKVILDFDVSTNLNDILFRRVRFNFYEIKVVKPETGGGASITFNTTNQAWFGKPEWIELTNSGWKFDKLGVTVISNKPVQNIQMLSNP